MVKTPFDDLATRLRKEAFGSPKIINEKKSHVMIFLDICRIKYRQMYWASEKFWEPNIKMMHEKIYGRHMTIEDLYESQIDSIEAKVNYFSFIEELNRFGRLFVNKYSNPIPNLNRIRFYRNKMIEHLDEYEEFLNSNGTGINFKSNKLVIPFHAGSINKPEETKADYEKLRSEFGKYDVTLSPLDLDTNDKYSNLVFENLEKIDRKLDFKNRKYDNLINCLLRYGFPTPIHDLEEYVQKLIAWMEEFLT
jgi:hypothetical protein